MVMNFSLERDEDYRPARRGERGEKGLSRRQNEGRRVCLHTDKMMQLFVCLYTACHLLLTLTAQKEEQTGGQNLVFAYVCVCLCSPSVCLFETKQIYAH